MKISIFLITLLAKLILIIKTQRKFDLRNMAKYPEEYRSFHLSFVYKSNRLRSQTRRNTKHSKNEEKKLNFVSVLILSLTVLLTFYVVNKDLINYIEPFTAIVDFLLRIGSFII